MLAPEPDRCRIVSHAATTNSQMADTLTPAPRPSVVMLLTRLATMIPSRITRSERIVDVAPSSNTGECRSLDQSRPSVASTATINVVHHSRPNRPTSIITLTAALCAPPRPVSSKNTPLAEANPRPNIGWSRNDCHASVQISVRRLNVPICSAVSPRMRS